MDQGNASSDGDVTATSGDSALAAIEVRLPTFWPKNPQVWFTQVEASFHLRRITPQIARYYHVVASLPAKVADQLDDVLALPPREDAYDHLKTILLARTMTSESSRIQQLLTAEELGDRRPTQLLHRMKQLLGPQASDAQGSILRELFLQKLPQGMHMILAAADDMPLDRLAVLADRTAEYSSQTYKCRFCPAAPESTAQRPEYLSKHAQASTRPPSPTRRAAVGARHQGLRSMLTFSAGAGWGASLCLTWAGRSTICHGSWSAMAHTAPSVSMVGRDPEVNKGAPTSPLFAVPLVVIAQTFPKWKGGRAFWTSVALLGASSSMAAIGETWVRSRLGSRRSCADCAVIGRSAYPHAMVALQVPLQGLSPDCPGSCGVGRGVPFFCASELIGCWEGDARGVSLSLRLSSYTWGFASWNHASVSSPNPTPASSSPVTAAGSLLSAIRERALCPASPFQAFDPLF
ncbi:hypothetical protein HPB47_019018 [Ixodes persulcatus]|uniref:Uncharacterized protein n=1 Tax=Ixodes persulcatus TaxID=34615 RepID=A0AC60QJ93_IXOPE|nr:hypothetical protein HPB47_019018 [Ixodes persulcatus]